ncbi:hypothetical protein ABL78_7079 [Leptomonas seymouri]|uniref:Uncharacterized protein n=1 Tax=Leptomonas seymouri TaxID=5684 RepID=A0A0N1HSW5_LEPSE|nr:hypothetical protein ABL78_7079 [Leptomonas seymouri]|eukprot:KPI83881.1 hypothetical protein ABL78_7079 [Leptomonas seymouri]
MRRRVGVGHVLQEREQQKKMADLGAQITAERVGQIEDLLDELQAQLQALARNHKADIKADPVVRARFRQLADSLGVDLISSKKNVFAGALGLGDFYYQLAGRVVEACMQERKFCGAYVPLQRVQFFVQKAYDSSSLASGRSQNRSHANPSSSNSKADEGRRTIISEADILTALSKLSVLGAGYNVVKLGGVSYIQTTPDGARGGDHVLLLNYVLNLQRDQVEKTKQAAVAKQRATSASLPNPSPQRELAGPRSGVGAAYALGAHPFNFGGDSGTRGADVQLTFAQQCVALREAEVADGLHWETYRARAALKRMVQEGTVWVEEPQSTASSAGAKPSRSTKTKPVFSAAGGGKEVWKGTHKGTAEEAEKEDVVYWFVSLTPHA